MLDDCRFLAAFADQTAKEVGINDQKFVENLQSRLQARAGSPEYGDFRASGFKDQFKDEGPGASYNQVRHFVGTFAGGFYAGLAALVTNPAAAAAFPGKIARATVAAFNARETSQADSALNEQSVRGGVYLALGRLNRRDVGKYIRDHVCAPKK